MILEVAYIQNRHVKRSVKLLKYFGGNLLSERYKEWKEKRGKEEMDK